MLKIRPLFLIILIIFVPKEFVSAFPQLSPLQGEELWDLGKAFGSTLTGIGTAIGSAALNIFMQPDPSDSSKTVPQTDADSTSPPIGVSSPEPAYGLKTPPAEKDEPLSPPLLLPPKTEECDSTNTDSEGCDASLDQIIFTSSCAKLRPPPVITDEIRDQNQAIWDRLNEMAPSRVRKSTSSLCDVFLFIAPLTAKQREETLKLPGVNAVVPNQALKPSGRIPIPQDEGEPAKVLVPQKRGRVKKRAVIRSDPDATVALKFISTLKGYPGGISDAYFYDDRAGRDTVVFPIGAGVELGHEEFTTRRRPVIRHFFRALDSDEGTIDVDSFGSCIASIIGGPTYGVSKETDLIPVKIAQHVGSILDAFNQVLKYVDGMVKSKTRDQGYAIVLGEGWPEADPRATEAFDALLDSLVFDYDVVVVVAAGEDYSEGRGLIGQFPAILAADTPIISVGAVDIRGATEAWSRGGNALTVSAPGTVKCAANQAGSDFAYGIGTHIAAALVGAVAVYHLSTDIGDVLRADPEGVPAAVKRYIVDNAYARMPGGDEAIWNLLGSPLPSPGENN